MTITAQQRSLAQQEQRWQRHRDCEADVRQQGPHWGIYCVTHNRWIQWIGKDQVAQITKAPCENN